MRQESGRSLIEIMGALVIAGVMAAASLTVYNNIRANQKRTIAVSQLRQIAQNTKLLVSHTNDYSVVSVDYLIKSGALKNNQPPIGTTDWTITSTSDNLGFSINLTCLTKSECEFFTTVKLDFVYSRTINGYENGDENHCLSTANNKISLFIE